MKKNLKDLSKLCNDLFSGFTLTTVQELRQNEYTQTNIIK
jgi:hypothetical protein